jgi:transcriptional regulator with XRE-family HTH domain
MERMRQLREEKGLSQAQAAVRAGMDPGTWNRLERGKGNPNIRTLERVADSLGVEVADLLGKAPSRSSHEPSLLNGLNDERPATITVDVAKLHEVLRRVWEHEQEPYPALLELGAI